MTMEDTILLVEDDSVDVMTIRRAMRESGIENPLVVVNNGEEALEWLLFPGNIRPALILLDLNMPRMNGLEFLRAIRSIQELKNLSVVVLTTSCEERDRTESFDLNVAGYMLKPVDYARFTSMMQIIYFYWKTSQKP